MYNTSILLKKNIIMKDIAQEIHQFLEKYSKNAADYDPQYDSLDERFNGPDSSMFYTAALQMEQGQKPYFVHSDWHSGCYKTNLDKDGEKIHKELLECVNTLAKTRK